MIKEMIINTLKDLNLFDDEAFNELGDDPTVQLSYGIEIFIEKYLKNKLPYIQSKFIKGNLVNTLNMSNTYYTWKIINDYIIIMISFNDLDFEFNSIISFMILNDDGSFYKKEISNVNFKECVNFIINTINEKSEALTVLSKLNNL
jgi:hypothetical protein